MESAVAAPMLKDTGMRMSSEEKDGCEEEEEDGGEEEDETDDDEACNKERCGSFCTYRWSTILSGVA